MTGQYYVPAARETYVEKGEYTPDFLKWKGFVDRNPLLRSILNANADAVTASWKVYGRNDEKVAKVLDKIRGNKKESFRLLMNNAIKVAKICGDYYAEIVYDENDNVENLMTLPPNLITQEIENGQIVRYRQNNKTEVDWEPEQIFHIAYNPIGSQTHGNSVIEPMQNILTYMEALMQRASKIFEKYVKPTNVIYTKTDSPTQMAKIEQKWKEVMQTDQSDQFVPARIIDKIERVSIPQGSILDPSSWERVLRSHLIMSSRVPELALGTGSVNSEESAKLQFQGFAQMVRWDQKFLEDNLFMQLFPQIAPTNTPRIEFSYASEPVEEKERRLLDTIKVIQGTNIDDSIKQTTTLKILVEMGVIPDE